jgi:hypothetical protein
MARPIKYLDVIPDVREKYIYGDSQGFYAFIVCSINSDYVSQTVVEVGLKDAEECKIMIELLKEQDELNGR